MTNSERLEQLIEDVKASQRALQYHMDKCSISYPRTNNSPPRNVLITCAERALEQYNKLNSPYIEHEPIRVDASLAKSKAIQDAKATIKKANT